MGGHDGLMASRRTTYTIEELEEVAAGLRRLLDAIRNGSMTADAGTISRLEGALCALQALMEGLMS